MIVIDKWAGLVTNASPYAIPPGAAVTQVNLQCIRPGELQVRPGVNPITFASHTGSTASVVSMFRLPVATETILYQGADGSIRIAKGPS